MSTEHDFAGTTVSKDYLKKFVVILEYGYGSSFDFTHAVFSISITEDIFHPTVVGHARFVDAGNIIGTGAMKKNDVIEIALYDSINERIKHHKFAIAEIKQITPPDSNVSNQTAWDIKFVSEEFFTDGSITISRALHSPNKTTSDIVYDMLIHELGAHNKKHDIEQTVTKLTNYIAPNISPMSVCYAMSPLSFSAENPLGSLFLFFETLEGYTFRSFESLTNDVAISKAIKYKETKTGHAANDVRAFNVLEFSEIDSSFKAQLIGAAGSKTEVLNVESKNVNVNAHDPGKDGPSNNQSDPNKRITAGVASQYKRIMLEDANGKAGANNRRKATIGLMLSIFAAGEMDFSLDLNAGKMIEVYSPRHGNSEDDDEAGIDRKLYTGPYLIKSVCHQLTASGPVTKVDMIKNIFNLDPTASYKNWKEESK